MKRIRGKQGKQIDYDLESLKLDQILFTEISKNLIPQKGAMEWLRQENFGGHSFLDDYLKPLSLFEHRSFQSDFEFLDTEIETFKNKLLRSIKEFNQNIRTYTFSGGPNKQTIPPEWEFTQPERFEEARKYLNESAENLCKDYDRFIKLGRRKLKV